MRLQKPIIFIGTGRSGTSVISEIIMRHKDLAFPSQYQDKFYKYPKINLIRTLFENNYWRIFGQKKQLNKVSIINKIIFKPSEAYQMWKYLTGNDIDFSRGFLLNQKASSERVDFIHNYFQKLVSYQNRNRLAFKITGSPRIGYLLSIFPDAYFIVLKRKPIPTISSFLKVKFWKNRGMNQLWWTGAYSEEEEKWATENKNEPELITAFQIKKILEVTKYECQKYKPNYIYINYEDFVAEPMCQIRKILNFAQLSADKACVDYLEKNKIYNRNKADIKYFGKDQLEKIYKIINI
jgi:omega-hydroxy-beta-dihydromenaquinone-9 sulfotransferase